MPICNPDPRFYTNKYPSTKDSQGFADTVSITKNSLVSVRAAQVGTQGGDIPQKTGPPPKEKDRMYLSAKDNCRHAAPPNLVGFGKPYPSGTHSPLRVGFLATSVAPFIENGL